MVRLASTWTHSVLPDYTLPGVNDVVATWICAALGTAMVFAVIYALVVSARAVLPGGRTTGADA